MRRLTLLLLTVLILCAASPLAALSELSAEAPEVQTTEAPEVQETEAPMVVSDPEPTDPEAAETAEPPAPDEPVAAPAEGDDNAPAEEGAENTEAAAKGLEVYYFDVDSRVDSILIRCDGVNCFIDAGFRKDAGPALENMAALGVQKLDYYIGTHAHADHVGGAATIIHALKPDCILIPHKKVWLAILDDANSAMRETLDAIGYTILKHGEEFALGGATVKCLGPVYIRNVDRSTTPENANSLILRLTYGTLSFLFTGDATGAELSEANQQYPGEMRANVFKNPHHNGDFGDGVIQMVQPNVTVFCTMNGYEPDGGYKRALKKAGSDVYIVGSRNDGNVLITTDGKDLQVYTGYPLTEISLNPVADTMIIGQKLQLKGTLKPESRANAKKWLNWRSSDRRVADVSEGVVTGVGEGTAVITATSINGLSDSVEIQVRAVGLALNENKLTLKYGESFRLKAIPSSDEAKKLTGEWLSEDPSIAAVTEKGEVLAAGVGETRVIARLSNGAQAVCEVEVTDLPVSAIALNKKKLTLSPGEQAQLTAMLTPSYATDRRLEWVSSDEKVATVDESGNVTAIAKGTAKVGVRASSGVYAVCKVTVK